MNGLNLIFRPAANTGCRSSYFASFRSTFSLVSAVGFAFVWMNFAALAQEVPHVVLVAGDAEYGSRTTCARIQKKLEEQFGFKTTLVQSMVGVLENSDNPDKSIPGLEVIKDADLLIIFIRMRIPPQEQLDLLHEYFESGKPAIGMRTTTHAFTNDRGWCPRYFGGHYWTHLGGTLDAAIVPEMRDHPVLRGVQSSFFQENNSLYITNPLSDTATPLVYGRRDASSPAQAFAWINEYKQNSRQFFFTASHPENFKQPDNQKLLYNAVFWALGRDVPAGGVLNPGGQMARKFVVGNVPAVPRLNAPAEAEVLFDGKDLSAWDFWFGGKEPFNAYRLDGRAHSGEGLPEFEGARWKVENGAAVAAPTYGDMITRETFSDYRLHFDFLVPQSPDGTERIWRGNSGVFLNSYYEVQILDSRGTPLDEWSCGAITGEKAPVVDAAKSAGEWQSMDITFHAARYNQGLATGPATATVLLNGIKVQDSVSLPEATTWGTIVDRGVLRDLSGSLKGPIRLQADSSAVRFANVWVEEIQVPVAPRRALTGKPWVDMDYGQFKTHSLEVAKGNMANKAIAIRVDPGEGGVTSGSEFLLFETDTLRMAGGWTGPEFNNWRNIMHNGEHQTYASIVGHTVFANPDAPGWGNARWAFDDTRFLGRDERRYGPMDKAVGQWNGLYVHGDKVVLSYEVGESKVLELPGAEGSPAQRAFSRTFNIGPRKNDLILQIAHQERVSPKLRWITNHTGAAGMAAFFPAKLEQFRPAESGRGPWITLDGRTKLLIDQPEKFDLSDQNFTFYARVRTEKDGTIFSQTAEVGPWVPFGKTFFVRGGRLFYDVGWVGAVESERSVDNGEWHRVAVSYEAAQGRVRLYVDGTLDGEETLKIPSESEGMDAAEWREKMQTYVVQMGYTAPDFPTEEEETYFEGSLGDVRFYNARLSDSEIQGLGRRRSEYQDQRIIARWDFREIDQEKQTAPDASGHGHLARIVERANQGDSSGKGITVAAVVGDPGDVSWITTLDGHLRLKIPAGDRPAHFKVLISQVGAVDDTPAFDELVRGSAPPIGLRQFTQGGPRRWTESITTKVTTLGPSDGSFVVETITVPFENPYHSMMRLGGFDFFNEPSRAAVCTAMGDVWIVDGVGGELDEFTWTRIATGMYEPLGLKIVDEQIYVTCRDQITRLHDFNGDGEIDYYESFNHDNQTSAHFHEFAMSLETDQEGNFYYLKAAGHDMAARFPQHGTLIKVSKDGSRSDIIANGFRAPNGLWVCPDGKFFLSTDQEGHWTPMNRINRIVPGGFYGYMLGWHEPRDADDFIPPVTWMHKKYENSPSRAFMIESEKWGPLNGKMASLSYGKGKIFVVLDEKSPSGLDQGGITELDAKSMPTGLERSRFNPNDGQMYTCGMNVWCTDQPQIGGFYRVRYTDKPLHMPIEFNVANNGVVIRFTDPLDQDSATDSGNYSVEMWKYLRRREYGSADYKVLSSGVGHDSLEVRSAAVSRDRKSVFLEIPGIQPVQQMHIDINVRAADGTRMRTYVHNTIHEIGKQNGADVLNR